MCHDTEERCKIWKKSNFLFQKWQEFGEFWSEHSKFAKICTLIGYFCAKCITFDLKKYIGFIFHDTEEWCKIWLVVWKMTWGIWQIFTKAVESLKIGALMRSFIPNQKMHELKIYRRVICHDNEEWWKMWRGIYLSFQKSHEELDKFSPRHSKVSKKFHFNRLFLSKAWIVWAENVQKSYRLWHWRVMQNFEKSWCVVSKLTRVIWQIFTRALKSLKNF